MNQKQFKQIGLEAAAQVIGRGVDFVRWGLQQGVLPFGVAVRSNRERASRHYSYLIDAKKLADFAGVSVESVLELNRQIKMKRYEARQRRLAACKE